MVESLYVDALCIGMVETIDALPLLAEVVILSY
jgi:hypothetical protein